MEQNELNNGEAQGAAGLSADSMDSAPGDKSGNKSISPLVVILLLIPAAIFFYYMNRFPLRLGKFSEGFLSQFNTGTFSFPAHLFREIIFIVWFTFNCIGSGLIILKLLSYKRTDAAENIGMSFAAGFLFIGLVVFALGIFHLLYTPVLFVMMILLSVLIIIFFLKKKITLNIKAAREESVFPALKYAAYIILGFTLLILFLSSSVPPDQSDGVRYHLAAPQEFLKAHCLRYIPHNANSNLPFIVEMNFMLAMGTFGDYEAQCVHLLCLVFSLFLIYGIVRRLTKRSDLALCGALLWATIPSGAIISSWPFIDHGIVLFFLFHLNAMIDYFEENISDETKQKVFTPALLLAAISMGGLVGTKYTMMVPWVFSGVMIFVLGAFRNNKFAITGKTILSPLVYFIVSFILFAPWLIKNVIYTGNPFYFMLSSIFPGGEWGLENAQFLAAKMAEKGLGKDPLSFILGIFNMTFIWGNFEYFNPGPAPLMLLLFVVFALIRRVNIMLILYFGLLYGMWFFSYQSGRFFMPCFALLIVLGMTGADYLLKKGANIITDRLIYALILFAAIYSSLWIMRYQVFEKKPDVLPAALGFTDRDSYLSGALNYYSAALMINGEVPKGESVLLVGEHRGYYFSCDYLSSDWFDTPILLYLIRQTKDNDELFAELKKRNITYVFFNFDELNRYREMYYKPRFTEDEYRRAVDFEKSGNFKVIFNDSGRVLVKIKS